MTSRAIKSFWSWWAERAEAAAQLVRDDKLDEFAQLVTDRVRDVHPDLVWELAQPTTAEHCLVVSGGGLAERRGVAERWLRAAPSADATWEYLAARPPAPGRLDSQLTLNDHELDMSHVAFAARYADRSARFDVAVYHPDFEFLDEETRLQVAFLALDWSLGEDDVARWIGRVDPAVKRPLDTITAAGLRSGVGEIAALHAEPQWMLLSGAIPGGGSLLASVRFPLRKVDFPLHDEWVGIDVPFREVTAEGFPEPASLDALRALEEQLTAAAGDEAALVAHTTARGRRTFHFYADPDTDATGRLRKTAKTWSEGRAKVQATADPGWSTIEPFTT